MKKLVVLLIFMTFISYACEKVTKDDEKTEAEFELAQGFDLTGLNPFDACPGLDVTIKMPNNEKMDFEEVKKDVVINLGGLNIIKPIQVAQEDAEIVITFKVPENIEKNSYELWLAVGDIASARLILNVRGLDEDGCVKIEREPEDSDGSSDTGSRFRPDAHQVIDSGQERVDVELPNNVVGGSIVQRDDLQVQSGRKLEDIVPEDISQEENRAVEVIIPDCSTGKKIYISAANNGFMDCVQGNVCSIELETPRQASDYEWSYQGNIPQGLSVNNGRIDGTPSEIGLFRPTIEVVNNITKCRGEKRLTINVRTLDSVTIEVMTGVHDNAGTRSRAELRFCANDPDTALCMPWISLGAQPKPGEGIDGIRTVLFTDAQKSDLIAFANRLNVNIKNVLSNFKVRLRSPDDHWLLQGIKVTYEVSRPDSAQPRIAYWNPCVNKWLKSDGVLFFGQDDVAFCTDIKVESNGTSEIPYIAFAGFKDNVNLNNSENNAAVKDLGPYFFDNNQLRLAWANYDDFRGSRYSCSGSRTSYGDYISMDDPYNGEYPGGFVIECPDCNIIFDLCWVRTYVFYPATLSLTGPHQIVGGELYYNVGTIYSGNTRKCDVFNPVSRAGANRCSSSLIPSSMSVNDFENIGSYK